MNDDTLVTLKFLTAQQFTFACLSYLCAKLTLHPSFSLILHSYKTVCENLNPEPCLYSNSQATQVYIVPVYGVMGLHYSLFDFEEIQQVPSSHVCAGNLKKKSDHVHK